MTRRFGQKAPVRSPPRVRGYYTQGNKVHPITREPRLQEVAGFQRFEHPPPQRTRMYIGDEIGTAPFQVGERIRMYEKIVTVGKVDRVNGSRLIVEEGVSDQRIADFKNIVEKTPEKDRDNIQFVLLRGGMRGGTGGTTMARFIQGQNTVYVSARSGLTNQILLHEIGHARYFTKLSSDERTAWGFHHSTYNDQLPTEYRAAKFEPEEGYAESYAAFHEGKELHPELAKFFRSTSG